MEEQFVNAIGVLGVYFALMAVLAIAVETVMGWLKLKKFQSKPSPEAVLEQMKAWMSEEEFNKASNRINVLEKTLRELDNGASLINKIKSGKDEANDSQIAEWANDAFALYIQEEKRRRAIIRLITIGLGIGFAFIFQIDTVQLLLPIFSEFYQLALLERIAEFVGNENMGAMFVKFIGFMLSGLAASAGSSYWHDQSARLRNIKDATDSIRNLVGSR